jgi:hypothetical protein
VQQRAVWRALLENRRKDDNDIDFVVAIATRKAYQISHHNVLTCLTPTVRVFFNFFLPGESKNTCNGTKMLRVKKNAHVLHTNKKELQ